MANFIFPNSQYHPFLRLCGHLFYHALGSKRSVPEPTLLILGRDKNMVGTFPFGPDTLVLPPLGSYDSSDFH